MGTAELLAEMLPQFCPTTNHYRCSDGKYLLVTKPTLDAVGTLKATLGITVPVSASHLPTNVEVFLSNEDAEVVDVDGDLTNGLTPIASFVVGSHDAALAELGYRVKEG
ncbi:MULTISPECIES: DUF7572 family protein [Mycobacteroides]|uniref:DUF7572 family protein n=1 Tax=Mycobacteroides TaxID=670516 RepID=UPI000926AC9F|nr:hypothetical protein [Mycobacteroides abscessus]NGX06460.1 hypothetical protein [Mycobacteroides franklinii]SHT27028.1 Uncharacterised protein [Mycobacteroides abscessus subsp. abscessus]SHW70202.1 Uncharacterised protein [Mycobacteroides abscessus subsp. abscessus]SHY72593.1 Uncharacterised protein [Mycobacteroides abscessus subsp. abscessus]SHZ42028.1 Uncharacterised protein [Mycobacteroides abscessus subsp. abscessus]